jgi:GxxExxY protein
VTLLPDRDPETFAIIGAAMEVHRHLGMGFLEAVYVEAVYVEALHYELTDRDIPFAAEVTLPITFKGRRLVTRYRADLVCYGQVIVELKALRDVGGPEMAQVLNYLKASGLTRGLLLNFGTPQLTYRRFIWSADHIHR